MLSYFPLIVLSYSDVSGIKLMNFAAITVAELAIALFTAIRNIKPYAPRERISADRIIKSVSPTMWFFAGFFIIQLISTLFSEYALEANSSGLAIGWFGDGRCEGMLIQILYAAIFVLLSIKIKFERKLIYIVSFTLLLMNAVAVVQLFGYNIFWLYPNGTMYNEDYFGVFYSTIGNIDVLGSFYCLTVPAVLAGFVLLENRTREKILLLCSAVTSVFVIIEINVSACLLAFCILFVIFIPIFMIKGRAPKTLLLLGLLSLGASLALICGRSLNEQAQRYDLSFEITPSVLIAAALGTVLVIASFLIKYIPFRPSARAILITLYICEILLLSAAFVYLKYFMQVSENSNDLVRELTDLMRGKLTEYSGSRRIAIWKCSFMVFAEHPILGVGAGAFKSAFTQIAGDTYKQYSALAVDMAHNDYLQTACSYGVLGLVCQLGFIGTLIFRAARFARLNQNLLVLLPCAVCFCVQAFFSFSLVFVLPIWIVVSALTETEIRRADC